MKGSFMKKYLVAMVACACFSMPAFAEQIGRMGSGGCDMTENASVSINFNGSDKDVTAVKNKLDDKINEIKALAEKEHFDKFEVQSNNYSINSTSNGDSDSLFQYSGSASFTIQPADKALDFMGVLTKKGYHASVNVSSYHNGGCNAVLR